MINNKIWLLCVPIFLLMISSAWAKGPEYPGPYSAEVYYITDGDTFFARVNLWPGINTDVSIRIRGVDTPESWRPKCDQEKIAGKAATDFLINRFNSPYRGAVLGKPMAKVTLINVKLGKYAGRALADVLHEGEDVASLIIEKGHGKPYQGGKRQSWCIQNDD
ncbi:thermonuclease family protein [Sneathiella sp.]|jgi:micrococcal nuclease|uniref:thermonuclease family protein n=1 Tax=Sneathiella sp. TaxID=1964365 RepID=UPI0039E5154E